MAVEAGVTDHWTTYSQRYFALLAIICVLINGPARAAGANDPFLLTISHMKTSVGGVECFHRQPDSVQIIGTAFFVSEDGKFITPLHVIRDLPELVAHSGCELGIMVMQSMGTTIHYEVAHFDAMSCIIIAGIDVASCSVLPDPAAKNRRFVPMKISSSIIRDGEAVAFTGFPSFANSPITSRADVAGYVLDQLIIDKAAWPGSSGSPVYDQSGVVIGMLVQAGQKELSGTAFAVPGYMISRFLRQTENMKQNHK